MSGGREFQRIDAATGNERRPAVARRYVGTCSWYDDDERRQISKNAKCTGKYVIF